MLYREDTMNILIVEDNPIALMGVKGVLGAFDAKVFVAETGQKALELAAQTFDIILMDIGLPDTDGFNLTREIHEKCPANKNTKVIALTAHTDEGDKIKEYGLVGLINKPLTLENFTEILKQLGVSFKLSE
jgi:two-component system aerobic respiration control sensor histidine kinase ArcB